MNDSVEISIVLPVYNVIDYLDECIKSILRQSNINFELIVVDDGSTDGSQILRFHSFYFYSCREKKRFLGCIDDCVRHINQNLWDCGVSFFPFL